jgi:hypothetical protein
MNTYKVFADALQEGEKYRVIEYDDSGNPYAAYDGYFNAKKFLFTLYPSKSTFVQRDTRKKVVSAALVRKSKT